MQAIAILRLSCMVHFSQIPDYITSSPPSSSRYRSINHALRESPLLSYPVTRVVASLGTQSVCCGCPNALLLVVGVVPVCQDDHGPALVPSHACAYPGSGPIPLSSSLPSAYQHNCHCPSSQVMLQCAHTPTHLFTQPAACFGTAMPLLYSVHAMQALAHSHHQCTPTCSTHSHSLPYRSLPRAICTMITHHPCMPVRAHSCACHPPVYEPFTPTCHAHLHLVPVLAPHPHVPVFAHSCAHHPPIHTHSCPLATPPTCSSCLFMPVQEQRP